MCPVVTEEKLLQSGWMKVKNNKVTSCTTLYVKIGEFSSVHLCSAQTHRLDQGTAFPHVYDRNTCYQKSISCCQLLIWGSAWRLTLYCRRCRRPFRCISFAFGSLKLHSHNLQWKRMTLPSSLRTWKRKQHITLQVWIPALFPSMSQFVQTHFFNIVMANRLNITLQYSKGWCGKIWNVTLGFLGPWRGCDRLRGLDFGLCPGIFHLHCGL